MGQKVHPLGFRVGITKKHQSQWFARFQKYAYAQSVVEDHMLRKTLLNLFNNLQPDVANAKQAKKAKITQIKIERGLIPYEIGIQVHADDCLSLTKAIDNLKINKDLVSNLQKTRQYLLKAATQLKTNVSNTVLGEEEQQNTTVESPNGKKRKSTNFLRRFTSLDKKRSRKNSKIKVRRKFGKKFKKDFKSKSIKRKKLSKTIFMRLKAIKKRLKKRQNLKKRYRVLIAKGLFIRKKGTLITRKVFIKKYAKKAKFKNIKTKKDFLNKQSGQSRLGVKLTKVTKRNSFTNRMYKKFANLFLTKLNKQFLLHLKTIMTRLRQAQTTAYAPLGYNHKWYSTKALYKATDLKMNKLTKLIKILEKKSLIKMESLRKDYITFGSLSPTRVIGYYQIITYLKQLKELVIKMSKRSKLDRTKTHFMNESSNNSNRIKGNLFFKDKIRSLIRAKSKQKKYITEKLIKNFQTIADNNQTLTHECRKVKLLSYLKDVVTKHRTENIFYYLATIADARKDLKNLKLYIKQHANFLFGINTLADTNVLMQKVTKALSTGVNSVGEMHTASPDSLQKVFLNFINDQRKMFKGNLALTPKISIKFFSVKTTDIVEKATVVADAIVDALEKRKAFRGVIKKAKEDLMRRPRVKGVKIQVAGRLNGAEIARSEWVRAGRVPLQTLRANIDYSYRTASTIYGIIGVKVWIFKGYTKIN